jgi:hypothetical protein
MQRNHDKTNEKTFILREDECEKMMLCEKWIDKRVIGESKEK